MRIEVDEDRCEANAVCEGIAPEVFRVDEEDTLHVLQPEPPAEHHDDVRLAVERCPRAALSVIE